MMDKLFIDVSNLTLEDLNEIQHLASALSISFSQALNKFIEENPSKARVVGEFKNKECIKDEISMEGIKETKGSEALAKIINDVLNRKE